jgi:hypothetical protein
MQPCSILSLSRTPSTGSSRQRKNSQMIKKTARYAGTNPQHFCPTLTKSWISSNAFHVAHQGHECATSSSPRSFGEYHRNHCPLLAPKNRENEYQTHTACLELKSRIDLNIHQGEEWASLSLHGALASEGGGLGCFTRLKRLAIRLRVCWLESIK